MPGLGGRGGGKAGERDGEVGVGGVPVNYFIGKALFAFSLRYRPAPWPNNTLRAAARINGLEVTPGGGEREDKPAAGRGRPPAFPIPTPSPRTLPPSGARAVPGGGAGAGDPPRCPPAPPRALWVLSPAPSFPFYFTC